jgi:Zn-dependent protease with chaperone function
MRRTAKYLITPGELRPGWIGLYLATLALQLPCAAIRAFLAYPALWLALKVVGASTSPAGPLSLIAGWGPLVLSAATVIAPLDGWWWEQREGGRSPSEREQLIYDDAIARLRQRDPRLREPRHWFVIDSETENAAAYASSLMVTRGLLDSGYLEAVISHELGHLNSSDGRLTAALCRLTVPPRDSERRFLNALFRLWSGSLAFWPLRGAWATYWRGREHHADGYAARLGQADTLATFLDERVGHDYPVPWVWLTGHAHPPTEHRVDRLAHRPA